MLKIMLQHQPEPNSIIQMTHHISSKHRNILMILHDVITWSMIILATPNVEAWKHVSESYFKIALDWLFDCQIRL